jgi:hypothetical protein
MVRHEGTDFFGIAADSKRLEFVQQLARMTTDEEHIEDTEDKLAAFDRMILKARTLI